MPTDIQTVSFCTPSLQFWVLRTQLSFLIAPFGILQVVVEFEGVVVEDTSDLHSRAWVQLAEDEGKSRPLQFALKRAEGMKNDQVCFSACIAGSKILCLTAPVLQAAKILCLTAQSNATPSAAPMPSVSRTLCFESLMSSCIKWQDSKLRRSLLRVQLLTGDDVPYSATMG